MRQFAGIVTGLSRFLDKIAGFCMVTVMVLVVSNILLRAVFHHPILGTYEYVVFLTAAMIGLSLAYCAVQNAHIAVSFVVDRFPLRLQAVVDVVMNVVNLLFWALCAWQVAKYARTLAASGVVSPTSQIPFYPFIYLVAFGLSVLCLVILLKVIESVKQVVLIPSFTHMAEKVKSSESIQKAASQ